MKGGVLVGRAPDCAAAPVTRITIWDQDSKPIWDVTGPPTALPAFIVGAAPNGFRVVTPYEKPADDAVVRLIVNRQRLGVAGVRYAADDLGRGKVTTYYEGAYHTFSRSGFQGADVCKRRPAAGPTSCRTASAATTRRADARPPRGRSAQRAWDRPRSTTPWRRRSTSAASMPPPCHALATRASSSHASPPVTSAPSA